MKALLLTIILLPSICTAGDYHTYSDEEIYNITSSAVLERQDIKLLTKNAETWGLRQLHSVGINEAYAEPVVLVLAPLAFKKVSSKGIHFHWEPIKNMTFRPDVEYYLDSHESSYTFNVNMEF